MRILNYVNNISTFLLYFWLNKYRPGEHKRRLLLKMLPTPNYWRVNSDEIITINYYDNIQDNHL